MAEQHRRRFSLDKVVIDPALKNRILSAEDDDHVGDWDGENIDDLVKELDRIEERIDANYNNLPHNSNLPEDLRDQVEKDFSIWACDRHERCLTGEHADKVVSVDKIRKHYDNKHGGVAAFRDKLRLEREQMVDDLKHNSK
jgi:hypothetical protein